MRALATSRVARRGLTLSHSAMCGTAPRRAIGAGYTGRRESGYNEAAMNKLRALDDQPFFMLNLLKLVDLEAFGRYSAETASGFKELARGETVYGGRLRDAPVPVKGVDIDTSDYNFVLLVKYPSISGFFAFIDSPDYHRAYPHRLNALEDGKSTLIASFPLTGSATEGLVTKVPGADD